MTLNAAFSTGHVAVITGGASGIGLAAAQTFARLGLKIAIADVEGPRLDQAVASLVQTGADAIGVATDVADLDSVARLERTVIDRFGRIHVLMNNAGIQPGSGIGGPRDAWERVIAVNLWGVINGTQAFLPSMRAHGGPGAIINTGSKQGITTPPGDPAYNVSKAGVKVFTEALEHDLRAEAGRKIFAHLLIPGFVFTALTANGRVEKPAGAWTPEQTVDFMMERLTVGDFYILCPDNDVTRALDEKRIAWAAGDIVENRPPLSRWHPDYAEAFKSSVPAYSGTDPK